MTKIYKSILLALVAVLSVGCFLRDETVSIPSIDILSIEVEGLKSEPAIDIVTKSVKLDLDEVVDIRNVYISSVTLTEGASSSVEFPGYFDLRQPLYVNVRKGEIVEWTITATQHIDRYFSVEGQIGESVIDTDHHIATAYVSKSQDLSNIVVTALKLGPEGITTYSDDPLSFTDFNDSVRQITVSYHDDIEEEWTLRVLTKDIEVEITSVNAWAKRIWLTAQGLSGAELGFNYRKSGDEEWISVDDVEISGGSFSACLVDLEPSTEYEIVAHSNDNVTPVTKVTTEDAFVLPNGGFEDWSSKGGVVYPYASGSQPFWGTGNDGAAMANTTLTESTTDIRPGSDGKYAASLQSKKAALMGIGKFAAGNIFLGEFGGLQGLNGLVNFGRPCTARPIALRGWVKYNCGTIDEVGSVPSARPNLKKGDKDEGQIMIAVGCWTAEEYGGSHSCPVTVNTKDESTFFNKNGKDVIGVGELIFTESTDGWVEFTLPLDYRSVNEVPTHMIIVCTGSRFGDYFTGSTKSKMIVDDLELVY